MAGEGGTVDIAMQRTRGQPAESPEQSFLATLSDPQVTLLSVCPRWSFRRSPGTRAAVLPLFPKDRLHGSPEVTSNQVSVTGQPGEAPG